MTQQATKFLQVSHSSLSVESSCQRKFEFRKLYPRKTIQEDFFAANVGKALHVGIQEYLVSGDEDRAAWALMKSFPHEDSFMQDKDDRDFNAALATLEEVISTRIMDGYELSHIINPEGETVPAIEVPFAVRLNGLTLPDGRGIEYVGYIDAIMRHKGSGIHRSLDVKTHRSYTKDRTANYKFNSQQLPYGLVIEHLSGQPLTSFDVLYLDCFVDLVEPRVEEYSFTKTKEDIQEWLLDTVLAAQRIQQAMEMNHFSRARDGCLSWNTPCAYLDICEIRDRDSLLDWFLGGEDPVWPDPVVPWIAAEIDVFGERNQDDNH